ncbi:MAG: glycosyltransferase family 39 protein [Candidatus Rokubacteria bacterium]|nr:glycosyltransferase family 39 protein [Candidatus Rokubacteria bacterium]
MLLTGAIIVLALHVLLILITGGYTVPGLGIAAPTIHPPLMLLLLLVIAWIPLNDRRLSQEVSSGHLGTIVFSASLLIFISNGELLTSGDTLPARYLPLSILREGNFDLDEFPSLYADGIPYYLRFAQGHYVSDYPVGAALLALPFYVPSVLGGVSDASPFVGQLEKLSAATIVALSAALLYVTVRRITDPRMSLWIVTAYALGSSSFSTSSQLLWQHGPSQLAITTALYCLVRGLAERRWVALAGFPLAFAVIARPTNAFIVLALVAYVVLHHRRQAWGLLLSGLPPVLFHLWYNARYFDDPLRSQFPLTSASLWTTPVWEGLGDFS